MAEGMLRIVFRGLKELRKSLEQQVSNLTRPEAKLRVVGQYIAERSKQSFQKQADPATGASWAPLAESTRRQKARLGYSPKALIRTGEMKNSIGFSLKGNTSVFVGPADRKAVFHQEGTVSGGASGKRSGGGRVHIPARPFIGISPQDEREIEKIIGSWIAQARR
jgi:phage virion morphogenesis protein